MHVAYVDDTKQNGRRDQMGKLVALGSAIFDEEQIQPFAERFRALYEEFDVPFDVELKWSNPQKKNWWAESAENRSKQTPMRQRVLQLAQELGVKCVVVVWDEGGGVATAGGDGPEDAVIKFMFERITMYLENSKCRGLIVFDKPGGDQRDEANWLTERDEMVRLGTEYVKPTAIVSQILTAPSHLHPQLQLADLVAGGVTAAVAGVRHGVELLPYVSPMLCTNFRGFIGGTGLKMYPDKLNNLNHWLFNENIFTRGNRGIELPDASWRYAKDDGL